MKRTITWIGFIVVIALIVWGLIAAQNKSLTSVATKVGVPAEVTPADWIVGSSTAVTLIEYGDFQCPACGAYYPVVKQLMADYGGHFRFVFRHFPLPQHKNAIPAALAAEAAGKQGKFWPMYDMLYQHQQDWSEATDTSAIFTSYATTVGVSIAQYQKDLKDPSLLAKINSQLDLGRKIGIYQTPSFFFNGKFIDTVTTEDQFKSIIDSMASSTAVTAAPYVAK